MKCKQKTGWLVCITLLATVFAGCNKSDEYPTPSPIVPYTWVETPFPVGADIDLYSVEVGNLGRYVVAGSKGSLFYYDQQEEGWNPGVFQPIDHNLNDICYYDNDKFIVVGDQGTVLISANNGEYWGDYSVISDKNLTYVFPVSSATFLIGTDDGAVTLFNPIIPNFQFEQLSDAPIVGIAQGREVSEFYMLFADGTAFTTSDFETWEPQAVVPTANLLVGFAAKPDSYYQVVSSEGEIFETAYLSFLWSEMANYNDSTFRGLSYSGEEQGFRLFGSGTHVLSTNSSWESFEIECCNKFAELNDLVFYSDNSGVAVGNRGQCMVYYNIEVSE